MLSGKQEINAINIVEEKNMGRGKEINKKNSERQREISLINILKCFLFSLWDQRG